MKTKNPVAHARSTSWPAALLSLLILSGCAGDKIEKSEGPPLSGEEITKLIVGNTVNGAIGGQSFSFYYKSAVSVSGMIGNDGDDDSGTWEIKDENVYCNEWIVFFDGVKRCYKWYKTARGYILESADAFRLRPLVVYKVENGNPLGF
jgi:hypothetical protein